MLRSEAQLTNALGACVVEAYCVARIDAFLLSQICVYFLLVRAITIHTLIGTSCQTPIAGWITCLTYIATCVVLIGVAGCLAVISSYEIVVGGAGYTGRFVISSGAFVTVFMTCFTLICACICELVIIAGCDTFACGAYKTACLA